MTHPSGPSRLNLCPQRDSDRGCLPFMSNLCLSFPRGSDTKLEPVCNLDTHIMYCIYLNIDIHPCSINGYEWLVWWLRLILALFSIFPLSFNNDNDRSIGNHQISTPNHEDMDGISENESRLVKYEFQDHMLLFSFRSNDRSIWYNDAIFIYIYIHVSYMQIYVYYLSLSRLWLNLQLVMAVEVLMKGGASRVKCHWPDWICQEKILKILMVLVFFGSQMFSEFWFYASKSYIHPFFCQA